MPHPRTVGLWTALAAASSLLAGLFSALHLPAAFLLGSMLAGIGFGLRGSGLALPRPAFQSAQALVGCLVAHALTGEIAGTLMRSGGVIVFVVLGTVAAGAVAGLVLTRLRILPGTAAAWGSAPGGAAAMVVLAEAHGSDPRLVAFVQYVRVVAVVLTASLAAHLLGEAPGATGSSSPAAPSLAQTLATLAVAAPGAGLALRLKVPAGAFLGPLVLGALLHATGFVEMALPAPLPELAYAAIGWSVGLRFTAESLRAAAHALPGVLSATGAMVALCGAWAWGLTFLLPVDFLTAFLATSPGGLDSVAIIAVGTGVDLSFVLAVQTLRLFVVLLTGPVLARWIARTAG